MAGVLILYSTTDGQTLRICQRVQQRVVAAGQEATLVSIDDAASIALERFDKVVIGARIRYGKHQPQVFAFIRRHFDRLQSMPTAFFSIPSSSTWCRVHALACWGVTAPVNRR